MFSWIFEPKGKVRIEDGFKHIDLDSEYLRDPTKKHVMKLSERDCVRLGVPHVMRDLCAHLYVPLAKCRRLTQHCPWRCAELQVAYDRCRANDFFRRRAMVSRRFYELYGIDDGHDHHRNFEKSLHNPLDPESHHSFYAIKHGHAKGHGHGHGSHDDDDDHNHDTNNENENGNTKHH